eukprot:tig00000042_g15651.t1
MERPRPVRRLGDDVAPLVRAAALVPSVAVAVGALVENALDAGATSVDVSADLATSTLRVEDNGTGIAEADLEAAGEPSCTSKIASAADLEDLRTFGFRGEALSSLSQVSVVEIVTRAGESAAGPSFKILSGGRTISAGPWRGSRAVGTSVTCTDLFFNRPVVRKMLATDAGAAAEWDRIRRRVERLALACPHVAVSLSDAQRGAFVLRTRRVNAVPIRFGELFGRARGDRLRPVQDVETGPLRVTGFCTPPPDGHSSKDLQFLYVNRQAVHGTPLHRIANRLYQQSFVAGRWGSAPAGGRPSPGRSAAQQSREAGEGSFPMFVIFITCPTSWYDMEVGPDRTAIEFSDWYPLSEALSSSLAPLFARPPDPATPPSDSSPYFFSPSPSSSRKRRPSENEEEGGTSPGPPPARPRRFDLLLSRAAGPAPPPAASPPPSPPPPEPPPSLEKERGGTASLDDLLRTWGGGGGAGGRFLAPREPAIPDAGAALAAAGSSQRRAAFSSSSSSGPGPAGAPITLSRDSLSRLRLVGQAADRFIVALDPLDGTLCAYPPRFSPPSPWAPRAADEPLLVTPQERAALERARPHLEPWGWSFSFEAGTPEAGEGYTRGRLRSAPRLFGATFTAADLREHAADLWASPAPATVRPRPVLRLLASRACRGAIMFGDRLDPGRCEEVLASLAGCRLPFQCAHGRPSMAPLVRLPPLARASQGADGASGFDACDAVRDREFAAEAEGGLVGPLRIGALAAAHRGARGPPGFPRQTRESEPASASVLH